MTPAELNHVRGGGSARDELEELLALWGIAEDIRLDDLSEIARSSDFRQQFWAEVRHGGDERDTAVRDLRRSLLGWLEERPRRSIDELMALARDQPDWDVCEVLARALERDRLRRAWVPKLMADLAAEPALSAPDHGRVLP